MPSFTFNEVEYNKYSYILVPYCKHGSLLNFLLTVIRKKERLSVELVRYFTRQLVEAVAVLHKVNGLAHLDLKPDNVVIKSDCSLALIDFAHAHHVFSNTNKLCGTKEYWPLEVRIAQ